LATPFDLEETANYFRVSRNHLARVAKRELGEPLGQISAAIKLDWARTLLRERTLSISDVAARVGYRDPLYFSKVFRRRFGQSPANWRKQAAAESATAGRE